LQAAERRRVRVTDLACDLFDAQIARAPQVPGLLET
jgi:hypothetical protein